MKRIAIGLTGGLIALSMSAFSQTNMFDNIATAVNTDINPLNAGNYIVDLEGNKQRIVTFSDLF